MVALEKSRYLAVSVGCIAPFIAVPLSAAPPCLPDHVQAYFDSAGLDYGLPQGQLEPYLASFFDEDKQPEPWAIVGDFNGDGVEDWAGLVRPDSGRLELVAVVSKDRGYSHFVLASTGPDNDNIYFGVTLEPPGVIEGFPFDDEDPNPSVTIDNPSVHLFYFEKSSVLYYFRDYKFHELWTSD